MRFTRLSPFALAVAAFLFLALRCIAGAQDARAHSESPLPPPTGFVNDFANVIDDGAEERLERILTNLKDRASIEFAVVTVPTTGGQEIFNYSLAVARGWGIGSPEGEKNGLLLLIAVQDRKYQVQVSRHLEGDLPDGLVGEIGRRMREPFRAGDYTTGIVKAVETFIATMGKQRGFTIEDVDTSLAYAPRSRGTPRRPQATSIGIGTCCLGLVVLLIVIWLFSGKRGGRGGGFGPGGGGGGLLNALLLANLASTIANGGRSSSGWGGSGDSSSGWGGGGFGGFGGGGDFGGGGAGGDW